MSLSPHKTLGGKHAIVKMDNRKQWTQKEGISREEVAKKCFAMLSYFSLRRC